MLSMSVTVRRISCTTLATRMLKDFATRYVRSVGRGSIPRPAVQRAPAEILVMPNDRAALAIAGPPAVALIHRPWRRPAAPTAMTEGIQAAVDLARLGAVASKPSIEDFERCPSLVGKAENLQMVTSSRDGEAVVRLGQRKIGARFFTPALSRGVWRPDRVLATVVPSIRQLHPFPAVNGAELDRP